ncbi:MAG: shikimate dehydrogenase [Chloroflexi bacterium]|nr:shikimate dehydrogenase [Chloroflexota bacterium]
MKPPPPKGTVYQAGVIGYPLAHSVSPAFQQAAFDALKIKAAYERWETPPGELKRRIASLRKTTVYGANVTVPHKESVIPLVDELDPFAKEIGAVNTIVNKNGFLKGYNTDGPGFIRALTDDGDFEPKGKCAYILGAGGAARAVAIALAKAGATRIHIANRTASRAKELVASLKRSPSMKRCELVTSSWGVVPSGAADLIVNTTTMGMKLSGTEGQSPLRTQQLWPGLFVCDLVYNPQETPLLVMARHCGAQTLGGLPMLIYQGAIAFELWTGQKPPVEVMFTAARKALG